MLNLPDSLVQALFVMRHGHSEANTRHRIVSDMEQGTHAFGLTDGGRIQVADAVTAWQIRNAFDDTGEIYCSPFLRARETAAIVSEQINWPVSEVAELRERFFGDLDQQDDDHYARVWAQDALDPGHTRWGVESVIRVRDRVFSFLETLSTRHQGKPVLLVTHGDTASVALTLLRHGDLRKHRTLGALSTAEIQSV